MARRILLADDDPTQLYLQQVLLERAGYEVRTAMSARGTLRQLSASGADLVLMDLRLPELPAGLELIRAIRESGSRAQVIVLSGWPEELYGTAEEQMVACVLTKPVPPQTLLNTVAGLVG